MTRRSHRSSGRASLNVRLLIVTLVVLAVGGAAVFLIHGRQVRRNANALLERAEEATAKDDHAQAIHWLQQYIQLRPDDPEARLRLAQAADASAKTPLAKVQAIAHFNVAIGHFPGRADLRLRKAELLLETGQYEAAVNEATQLTSALSKADANRAYYVKALGLYRQRRQAKTGVSTEDAAAALKAALEAQPGHTELAPALAELYREVFDPPRGAQADAVMDEMLKRSGPSAAAYLARHRYRAQYQLSGADADLRKALELAPEDVEVLLAQGDVELAAKDYPAAVRTFQRVVDEIAPSHRGGYLGLGRAYAAMGDRPKALEVWRQAIEKLGPGDLAFRVLEIQGLIEDVREEPTADNQQRVETSLKEVRETLGRMASDLTENHYGRIADSLDTVEAEYWLAARQPVKAAPLLARVAETSRRSDNFREDQAEALRRWWLLGQTYAALQHWDLAAGAYQQATQNKVNSGQAELAVAVALHNAGRLPQAIERYRRATQSQNVPAETWHLLARAELHRQLRNRNQRDWSAFHRALADAKRAVGSSAEVMLVEAEGAAAQGSTQEAVKLLAKAVEADPARILPQAVLRYERWGDSERADASLAALKSKQPAGREVALIEADLLARRRQPEAARQLLEKRLAAADAAPAEAAQWHAKIADLELGLGNLDAARRHLRDSHLAQPSDPAPVQRLGDLAIQLRDLDNLRFCEQKLSELEGDDGTLWRFFQAVRLLLEHPEAGKGLKPADEAASGTADTAFTQVREHQQHLLRKRSIWPATHVLDGLVNERLGRLDEAAAAYLHATALGSQSVTLYERLVSLLYSRNRAEEAYQCLDRLQDSLYGSDLLWSVERTSLTKSGRFVELAESAQRAARFRKDKLGQIWLGHALTLAAQNEDDVGKRQEWYRRAEEAFREATAGEGREDFRAWAGLVWYHVQRRQLPEARAALKQMEQAAKLDELSRHLTLAQGYQMIGDVAEAARCYDEAARLSPRSADVLERQARFYFATNPAKAQEVYETLVALKPGENNYRFYLASLLATGGEEAGFQRAMELLSQDAGGSAQRVANRRLQAILLMQRGETKDDTEALRLLRELVEEANTPAVIDQLLLAQLYERQEKLPEARRQYEYLVKVDTPQPAHLEAYLYFLLRHQVRDEFQRQLARLEALASEKNGLRVTRLRAQWYQQENRSRDIPPLIDEYRKAALAQAKDNRQKAQVLGHVAALCDRYALEERAEEALQEVVDQQLIEHGYRSYATWLGQKGRFADATWLILKHGATDAPATEGALLANVVAAAQGRASPPRKGQEISEPDLKAAEERVDTLLKKEPNDRQLLFAVGALRHVQNRKAEAEALYRRVVALRANDPAGLNNLALILSEQPENGDQALDYIHRALGQAPQSLELRDSLGLVLLNVGQADKAQEVLKQVVAKRKSNRRYLFHLAVANYRLGDLEAARRAFSQAKGLSLAEEVLTPSERQLLARLERDLDKTAPKGSVID